MNSLEPLIQAARSPSDSNSPSQLIRLAEEILRSRKVGRAPRGRSLFGVHQEIYERAKQQLLADLKQDLCQYNPQQMTARDWANMVRDRTFLKILDDAQLKRLAIEAQQHPSRTELRQHTLSQLVEAIRLSGQLARPHQAKFSAQFYCLIYEEAVNRTLTYVCRSIDRYDPDRGQNKKFMNWVNFRLDRVILECRSEFNESNTQELPALADLEALPQPDSPSIAVDLREYIEQDADEILRSAHIKNRPEANFRSIALARYIDEKSWAEISQEFGISIPTLSSFFQRRCQEFLPLFEQYLS
ncbi:hypothetical protein H6F67_22080 [Microcoleus sp. FACHB-1515]|uniref:hypothetical protein n=1 Tax=Cyanophyceae TaxID=3028117 RepID=UPI0016893AE4|nr:hypothetical protein [Microcoleus sp. FACHB-1515]MBD2092541.1 hypothetical protein [Microcoleus sp. FACHB-1515]